MKAYEILLAEYILTRNAPVFPYFKILDPGSASIVAAKPRTLKFRIIKIKKKNK